MRFHNLLVLVFVFEKTFANDPVTLDKSNTYSATISCYSGLLVRESSEVFLYDGETRIGVAVALKPMRNFFVQFDVTNNPKFHLKFIMNSSCEPNKLTTANINFYPYQHNHINITVQDTKDLPIKIKGTVSCNQGPIYLDGRIELSKTCFLSNYSSRIERIVSPIPMFNSKPLQASFSFILPRRHEKVLRSIINVRPFCYVTFKRVCRTNEIALARVELVENNFVVKHLEIETPPIEYELHECAKFGRLRKPKPQIDFFKNREKLLKKQNETYSSSNRFDNDITNKKR